MDSFYKVLLELIMLESKLLSNFNTRFPFFDQIEDFHLFGDRKARAFERIHDVWFTSLISMRDNNSSVAQNGTHSNEVISF